MTKTVVVEKGFDKIDVIGFHTKESYIPVLHNFNENEKIGLAKVFYDENFNIKATLHLIREVDGYPAISYFVKRIQNDVVVCFQIVSIGICDVPNIDPSIKKISEQYEF